MQCIERIDRHGDRWSKINWTAIERNVRRLQGRIFRKSKMGDKKGVRNLMELLVRSGSAKLLAIHTVTQENEGKVTPGMDGKVYLTTDTRAKLCEELFDYNFIVQNLNYDSLKNVYYCFKLSNILNLSIELDSNQT